MQFRRFEPRVELSIDEYWRIMEYVISSGQSGPPSIPLSHQPDRIDDGGPSAGPSLALQSLYANDAFKHPLADLHPYFKPFIPEPDFDDSDSNSDSEDNWEDEMDPVTFAR